MDSIPLTCRLGRQLEQLDRDIHANLAQVRRHRQALEQLEASQLSPLATPDFAALLRASLQPLSVPPGASAP